jgi:hypothetical protein
VRQQQPRRALLVRSVLDIPKQTSGESNGATKLDVTALESDIEHELKYRLAAKTTDDEKLYQSGESFSDWGGGPRRHGQQVHQLRLAATAALVPAANRHAPALSASHSGLERAQPPCGCL